MPSIFPSLLRRIATRLNLVARPPAAGSDALKDSIESLLILQARTVAHQLFSNLPLKHIQEAEFKVFSQFGEDGILQYLIRAVQIQKREEIFVEFGVQNYAESNTRFLMMNNLWRGLVIDGSEQNIAFIRNQDYFWRHDLSARHAWIDRDNINSLIVESVPPGDIGVLSIDIDGNDYWVWERIHVVRPVIVVIEWNSAFGADHPISIPYDASFQRLRAHYSNVYWGASIRALEHLGQSKGYALIGSNRAGNNLFFVRDDRLGQLTRLSAPAAYVDACFRESRDVQGHLNFLDSEARINEILDLPVVNVVTNDPTSLRQLRACKPQVMSERQA